jgi:hypothetical protein
MNLQEALVSISISEEDKNKDILMTWDYPYITENLKTLINSLSPLQNQNYKNISFLYTKYTNFWIYFSTYQGSNDIKNICITLCSKEFYPDKYKEIGLMFAEIYKTSLNPIHVLTGYLSIFGTGNYKEFKNLNYDPRLAKIGQISNIIRLFPDECSIFWAAVLLKKRIIVYSENITELQNFINSLPIFAW